MNVTVIDNSGLFGIARACEISRGNSFNEEMLLRILIKGHLSVLEHSSITFHITGISRVCSHQFVRHRIGCSYTQESQRHREVSGSTYPKIFDSEEDPILRDFLVGQMLTTEYLKKEGYNKEDIRYFLPQASITSIIVTFNLRSLWHFLDQRYCTRAQQEIKDLAKEMYIQASKMFPSIMIFWSPRCIKLFGRYCSEPCKENIMSEFRELKKELFTNVEKEKV